MAEYIEREAVIHSVTCRKVQEMLRSDLTAQLISGRNPSDWLDGFGVGMQQAINIIAAADVVEVVRCKDCKWHYTFSCPIDTPLDVLDNGFCNYGVAKMDGKGER